MKLLKGTRIPTNQDDKTPQTDKPSVEHLVLVNCSISGDKLTAGYFFCDRGLSAGNYRLESEQGRIFVVKLPDQAVNLPGIGQQFNYPFQIVEE